MARISNIQYQYYGYGTQTGFITISGDGISTTIQLNLDEAKRLEALATEIFNTRKDEFAADIRNTNPMPVIEHKAEAISTDEEIPF